MLTLPPISLYIHFPWCVKKCPYCDFNSHQAKIETPYDEYLDKLICDLNNSLDALQGRKITSIFLGGGTPSLFPSKKLAILFDYIYKKDIVTHDCEITLEANPGNIERGLFADYHNMGINRISLGVQSFCEEKLKELGRIHNKSQIYEAIEQINHAGFKNYNIDIMHGLPNQNSILSSSDLIQAINLKPTHISWYQLTIEPNTAFAVSKPILPDEDTLEKIEVHGKNILNNNGFLQYETSAYSKDGCHKSRHNLNYWNYGDYIGIGAGSHSKITWLEKQEIERIWKCKHPIIYLRKKDFIQGRNFVTHKDKIYEFIFNGIRLSEGIDIKNFTKTTGISENEILPTIHKAIDKKLVTIKNNIVFTTELGKRFLNEIINLFHPDNI